MQGRANRSILTKMSNLNKIANNNEKSSKKKNKSNPNKKVAKQIARYNKKKKFAEAKKDAVGIVDGKVTTVERVEVQPTTLLKTDFVTGKVVPRHSFVQAALIQEAEATNKKREKAIFSGKKIGKETYSRKGNADYEFKHSTISDEPKLVKKKKEIVHSKPTIVNRGTKKNQDSKLAKRFELLNKLKPEDLKPRKSGAKETNRSRLIDSLTSEEYNFVMSKVTPKEKVPVVVVKKTNMEKVIEEIKEEFEFVPKKQDTTEDTRVIPETWAEMMEAEDPIVEVITVITPPVKQDVKLELIEVKVTDVTAYPKIIIEDDKGKTEILDSEEYKEDTPENKDRVDPEDNIISHSRYLLCKNDYMHVEMSHNRDIWCNIACPICHTRHAVEIGGTPYKLKPSSYTFEEKYDLVTPLKYGSIVANSTINTIKQSINEEGTISEEQLASMRDAVYGDESEESEGDHGLDTGFMLMPYYSNRKDENASPIQTVYVTTYKTHLQRHLQLFLARISLEKEISATRFIGGSHITTSGFMVPSEEVMLSGITILPTTFHAGSLFIAPSITFYSENDCSMYYVDGVLFYADSSKRVEWQMCNYRKEILKGEYFSLYKVLEPLDDDDMGEAYLNFPTVEVQFRTKIPRIEEAINILGKENHREDMGGRGELPYDIAQVIQHMAWTSYTVNSGSIASFQGTLNNLWKTQYFHLGVLNPQQYLNWTMWSWHYYYNFVSTLLTVKSVNSKWHSSNATISSEMVERNNKGNWYSFKDKYPKLYEFGVGCWNILARGLSCIGVDLNSVYEDVMRAWFTGMIDTEEHRHCIIQTFPVFSVYLEEIAKEVFNEKAVSVISWIEYWKYGRDSYSYHKDLLRYKFSVRVAKHIKDNEFILAREQYRKYRSELIYYDFNVQDSYDKNGNFYMTPLDAFKLGKDVETQEVPYSIEDDIVVKKVLQPVDCYNFTSTIIPHRVIILPDTKQHLIDDVKILYTYIRPLKAEVVTGYNHPIAFDLKEVPVALYNHANWDYVKPSLAFPINMIMSDMSFPNQTDINYLCGVYHRTLAPTSKCNKHAFDRMVEVYNAIPFFDKNESYSFTEWYNLRTRSRKQKARIDQARRDIAEGHLDCTLPVTMKTDEFGKNRKPRMVINVPTHVLVTAGPHLFRQEKNFKNMLLENDNYVFTRKGYKIYWYYASGMKSSDVEDAIKKILRSVTRTPSMHIIALGDDTLVYKHNGYTGCWKEHDFSQYDSTQNPRIHEAFFNFINPEHLDSLEVLRNCHKYVKSFKLPSSTRKVKLKTPYQGLSGSPCTTYRNTLINLVSTTIAYLEDDILAAFADFGLKVQQVNSSPDIEDMTFLKSTFVCSGDTITMVPLLIRLLKVGKTWNNPTRTSRLKSIKEAGMEVLRGVCLSNPLFKRLPFFRAYWDISKKYSANAQFEEFGYDSKNDVEFDEIMRVYQNRYSIGSANELDFYSLVQEASRIKEPTLIYTPIAFNI